MKNYSVLNAQGQVVRTGNCADEDFQHQAMAAGEVVVEGHRPFPTFAPVLNYTEKRRREYPALGDQLDAIVKGLVALRAQLPPETSAMVDQVLAVKAKYPKQ